VTADARRAEPVLAWLLTPSLEHSRQSGGSNPARRTTLSAVGGSSEDARNCAFELDAVADQDGLATALSRPSNTDVG